MWTFGRKGESGFGACSTAEDVTKGIDGTSLTAIVTRASSGIGLETAGVLVLHGVHMVMAVRNTETGKKVTETIFAETLDAKVDVMELDLSSLASVRTFAAEYCSSGLPLNILVNNAGVMAPPFRLSNYMIELQFSTNHLGHFLLTNLLLETMKKTSCEQEKEGRIVIVSSVGHQFADKGIDFDKISDQSSYGPIKAYGVSKLANILHANELTKQFKEEKVEITANSLHPGVIATNLLCHHGFFEDWVSRYLMKNIRQGAATTCYVALHPQVKGVSGEYFADSNKGNTSSFAKDSELAKKLWNFSLKMTTP